MELNSELFAIAGAFNGVVALFYGVYVFLNNKHDRLATPFILMSFVLTVWGFSYWKWLLATNSQDALFWLMPLNIGSFFITVFFYHWVCRLVNAVDIFSKLVLIFSYIIAIVASLLVSTKYVVVEVGSKLFFSFWPTPGIVYTLTIFYLYGFVTLYALWLLWVVLRDAKNRIDKENELKFKFIIIGTIIAYGGGLTNFPLWYGIFIPPYGSILASAFPFVLGYTSVKHRLFNFKAIGAELLVFFILSVLFLEIIRADEMFDVIFRTFTFIIVGILSFLLIRSVSKEVENREKGERLARYLANANARLRELDKQKTEFVSIASHQLRSPIAAIKGYTSMIVEGSFGQVPKNLDEPLERILESGQRISIMVDDFLNVTRIEQGRMTYNMAPQNAYTLITSVVNELKVVAEKKGLELSVISEDVCKCFVKADEGKLKQIFSNLIDNAIKYTPQGWIHIIVSKLEQENKVLIKIQDTGIGIAPDEVQNLFQKFNRASNANEVNVLGTGLGLYIAREILKAHDGWINVESGGIGKGSTFVVELPACEEILVPTKEEK
jgi:signal transduction histidine kinase